VGAVGRAVAFILVVFAEEGIEIKDSPVASRPIAFLSG
jgi:hypothetical protein